MNIRTLTLPTHDLAAQHTFYTQILGLTAVSSDACSLTIPVGSSRLTFEQVDDFSGFFHVAFDIPHTLVGQAEDWLRSRLSLLADGQGRSVFPPGDPWNTTNLYFDDPAGNILEVVARHDQLLDGTPPFGPRHLLHISELGVVVPDVPQAVSDLGQRFGLHAFNGQTDTFTPVGGHDGMLIVVREGRGWFPVGRPAVPSTFELRFEESGLMHTLRPTEMTGTPLDGAVSGSPMP